MNNITSVKIAEALCDVKELETSVSIGQSRRGDTYKSEHVYVCALLDVCRQVFASHPVRNEPRWKDGNTQKW